MRIRIIVFVILLIIFVFFGFNNISEEKRLAISTWEKVANKEFSNWDFWAGTGLYFYEGDSEKYCVYMIYGSGVLVAYYYKSKAVINEGIVIISLPNNIKVGVLNENSSDIEVSEIVLVIEDDMVMIGDTKFVRSEGLNYYDNILK